MNPREAIQQIATAMNAAVIGQESVVERLMIAILANGQAALLEAMEECQITVAGKTHKLPDLFLVLATQNPIEQEGTYPLPEAQMDC